MAFQIPLLYTTDMWLEHNEQYMNVQRYTDTSVTDSGEDAYIYQGLYMVQSIISIIHETTPYWQNCMQHDIKRIRYTNVRHIIPHNDADTIGTAF